MVDRLLIERKLGRRYEVFLLFDKPPVGDADDAILRTAMARGGVNVELANLLPVLERRAEILAAYLFGSAARDAAAPGDLDLAVILRDEFQPDRFYEFSLAEELERALGPGLPVDLKIMNRSPLYFQFKVLREGTLIFNRDNALRGRYEAGMMMRYYDFKPFLDYYNRCLRERIKAG